MPKSLDSNIYGADPTDMAESIASDALTQSAGAAGSNNSDYWGPTKDEGDQAYGNSEARQQEETVILRKAAAGGGDREQLDMSKGGNRHRKGPSESHEKKDRAPASQSGMKNQ